MSKRKTDKEVNLYSGDSFDRVFSDDLQDSTEGNNISNSNTYSKDDNREATPLLGKIHSSNSEIWESHPECVRRYSVFCARLATLTASVLTTAIQNDIFITQYLVDRLESELRHNQGIHSAGYVGSGSNNNTTDSNNLDDIAQSQVSREMMYFSIARAFPNFISCLLFGAIVDMAGRKPALMSASIGSILMSAIVFVIIKFDLNTKFFFLAFIADGIFGSFYTFLLSNYAILADTSGNKKNFITWVTLFQAVPFSISAVASIALGYVIQFAGFVITSSVALCFSFVTLIVVVLLIPETLPVSKQRITPKKIYAAVIGMLHIYTKDGDRYTRQCVCLALVIFFVGYVNMIYITDIDTLFQLHEPLCWKSSQLGFYTAYRMILTSVLGMCFLSVLRKFSVFSDEHIAMIGALISVGAFILEALVKTTWQMYLVPLLLFPSFIVTPVARGVMSALSTQEKQGVMFSSCALVEVCCSLVSSTLFNNMYAATVSNMPGDVYFLMAAIGLLNSLLFFPYLYFNRELTTTSPPSQHKASNSTM